MKNITKKLTAMMVLPIVLAAPAYAGQEGSSYAGVQYAMTSINLSGLVDLKPNAVIGRFGHYMTDTFAIEGRIGFSMSDDTYTDFIGDTLTVEVDSLFGVYGVARMPMSDKASLYGLFGYTQASIGATAVISGTPLDLGTLDESGMSFGFGGDFAIGDNASFNAEFISYMSGTDYDATAFSLGVSFEF